MARAMEKGMENVMDMVAEHTLEQRLSQISHKVRHMDPEHHTPLLTSLIGALEGPASYDPEGIRAAVHSIEAVVEDFEQNLK